MTRFAGPRLEGYAILVGLGLVAALTLRRPELAILAAPFALVLAAGLRPQPRARVEVSLALGAERVIEGEPVAAQLRVCTATTVDRLEVQLVVPPDPSFCPARTPSPSGRRGTRSEYSISSSAASGGVLYDVGELAVRARTPLRVVGLAVLPSIAGSG